MAPADGDRLGVAAGVLSLLAEAAEERPLLCLIDDVHWADQSSAAALGFAARRLMAEGVVLLAAAREVRERGTFGYVENLVSGGELGKYLRPGS